MGSGISHYYGHIALAFAVLGTCLLSLAGGLDRPDGLVYDQLVRLTPASESRSGVLLVECPADAGNSDPGQWLEFLQEMTHLQARRVVFTFAPEHMLPETAHEYRPVFGLLPGDTLPLPGDGIRVGAVRLPPAEWGMSRVQPVTHQVEGEILAALVVQAAGSGPAAPFWVNFNGGIDRLPRVSLERVLQRGLVADLVRDRVVLVGISDPIAGPSLYIPGCAADQRISLLQFQGLAVDTLLGPGPIIPAGPMTRLLCILLVAGVSLFAYQGLPLRFAAPLTLMVIISYVGLAWGLLSFASYWPPVTEVLFIQVLMFLLLFTRKSEREAQALQDALLNTSVKLQERIFPSSVLHSQDYWSQVAVMVSQILDLNRLIFLERVTGDHRVREVKAIHCSLQDIQEKRRDYQRHPYSTAIDQGGILPLPRDYLAPGQREEQQYLVPLTFTGEVYGFWAFGVDPAKKRNLPLFDEVVKAFGEQIGELLFQRQQWLSQRRREENLLIRYLRLEGGDQGYKSLNTAVALLEKRLSRLENIFQGLDTATILYDLFGRVVQVNQEMTRLLEAAELPPFEMTALDFTVAVAGIERGRARRMLEKVILERGDVSLPAHLANHPGRHFLLKIRPLRIEEVQQEGENYPFSLQGILSELVDVTELEKAWDIKTNVSMTFYDNIRSHLDAIDTQARWLQDGVARERVTEVSRLIHRETNAVREALTQVNDLLTASDSAELVKLFPVKLGQALTLATSKVEDAAAERNIEFNLDIPESLAPLFVAEEELHEVLTGLLAFLVHDAVEGSTIRVRSVGSSESFELELVNTGFGIPDQRFQNCLNGADLLNGTEFRSLRRAVRLVRHWGGMIEGHSTVGEGTRILLRMQGFI